MSITIRPAVPANGDWITALLDEWGGPVTWADGRAFDCLALPALTAGERDGLAIYEVAGERAELVLLETLRLGSGIGTALLEALVDLLTWQAVRELWLTSTNDNLDALRFYQRRGFPLVEVRVDAMAEARRHKPTIPEIGEYGIPMYDELRLVRVLHPRLDA